MVNGKDLYAEKCQRCHALARAGGGANIGPDLDEAFKYAREDGLGERTVEGVVLRQIENVRRNSIMPADLVTGDDARDVAAYVAAVAGQPGEDTGALAEAGAKVSSKPIVAEGGQIVQEGEVVGQGGTSMFTAMLQPGTFAYVCTVPGHEEGGMKGELTVK